MNLRQLVESSDRPFASVPQVGRYFPAASVEDARRRLARSIERGDGPGVVIGGAGIGKSLLLQVLAAQYRERFDVVLLASAQLCTRRALLQAIHFELGLDYRRRDEGELRLSLLDTLLSSDDTTEGLLILVDEAQALPVHLLEELRLLTNLSRGGLPRVRLAIAGLPALEEKFACPELQAFSQRLAARCYVAPLNRPETTQYVRAQLAASKADADRLFVPAAYDALFTASDGVPRLVNQVCDRSLELANSRRLEKIDAAVIQAAWADLQQLPTTWEPTNFAASNSNASGSAKSSAANSSSIIEFGSLDEEPAERPTSIKSEIVEVLDNKSSAPVVSRSSSSSAPLAPARRPRVFAGPAPDAVDPFAEPFEEEELVLDSFATLASIFGTRTPRVENSREPSIARMVQHALDAYSGQSSNAETTPAPAAPTTAPAERETLRPTIRLARVNESPGPIAASKPTSQKEAFDDPADAILVIEDEPNDSGPPEPGVRRESYKQLFSRLRHGA